MLLMFMLLLELLLFSSKSCEIKKFGVSDTFEEEESHLELLAKVLMETVSYLPPDFNDQRKPEKPVETLELKLLTATRCESGET